MVYAVPSLQSLCLLKLSSLGRDQDGYEDNIGLPKMLVRELKTMRLFNGTFSHTNVSPFVVTDRSLSVLYDGNSWSFDSKTMMTSFMGNPMDTSIRKYKLDEETPIKAVSMLYDFMEVMDTLHKVEPDSKVPDPQDYVMKMTLMIDSVDWRFGRLIFTGPFFKFVLRINIDREGNKVLSHHAIVKLDGSESDYYYLADPIWLDETRETIMCHGLREELNEVDTDFKLEGLGLGDPEYFRPWEFIEEGLLVKFWKIVNM